MSVNNATQKEAAENTVQLSIPDLKVSEKGVTNFFWPVQYGELIDFGQFLEHKLANFLREHKKQEDVIPYKIASKHFVTTVCAIFQALLLKKRMEENDKQPIIPNDCDLWLAVMNDRAPKDFPAYINAMSLIEKPSNNRILQLLKDPYSFTKKIKTLKISASGNVKTGNLYLKKPSTHGAQNAIAATQRISLIQEQAAKISNPVYLISSQTFFTSIDHNQKDSIVFDGQLFNSFLSIVSQSFDEFNIALPDHQKSYLSKTLESYVKNISVHMSRLQKQDNIPSQLWTGTGGHVWDTMLRCEVKRRGGKVIAFDHGGGTSHLNHPEKGWVEMWSCDEFVTYNQTQVKNTKRYLPAWPILDEKSPKISSVKSAALERGNEFSNSKNVQKHPIKKACLLSTIYSIEDGRGFPLFPYIPYIDWQSRLMCSVKGLGYDISFKPHPDSRFSPPGYKKQLDINVIDRNFEDIKDDYDLYIFDLTNTSVFQPALKSNKPVLVVNFEQMKWDAEGKRMIKNRCGYLKGWHDESNRMQIDWDNLEASINSAQLKCYDNEFVHKFYT